VLRVWFLCLLRLYAVFVEWWCAAYAELPEDPRHAEFTGVYTGSVHLREVVCSGACVRRLPQWWLVLRSCLLSSIADIPPVLVRSLAAFLWGPITLRLLVGGGPTVKVSNVCVDCVRQAWVTSFMSSLTALVRKFAKRT
jgi:hypothetical protein